MHPRSLRQLTLGYTGIILGFFLALALITYLLFFNFARQQESASISNELRIKADDIAFLVGFYRNIVEQIAREQDTQDLVTFASPAAAQRWAASKQKLLPQNIGLALVSKEGNILGNPLSLRIGDRCQSDLSTYIAGGAGGRLLCWEPPAMTGPVQGADRA